MFHLDNNSGVSSMPAVGAMQDNSTRWFTEGAGNQSPSWPGQDWFNIVQAELLNVLTEGGVSPVKTQLNQLAAAIKSIVNKNALMRDNLLSEIKDKGALAQKTALDNLNGVPKTTTINGHSLTGNVNVTAQDIFNLQTVAIPANADLNNYTTPGLYYQNANANAKNGENYPAGNAGSLIVLRDAGCMQIYTEYAGANNKKPMQFMRGQYGGEWSAWSRFYDTANRPTPADIGALPTTGGTLNGNLTVKNTIQVGGVGNGVLNIGDNDSGLRSSADGQVDLWANNAKVGYWKSGTFSFTGQFVPSNYGNFDAKYQAKGSYTPAGQAYTKAESDGRYIQNIRLGAQVLSPSLALNYALGGGNVVTGFKTNGTWDMQAGDDHVYYRPIQYLHNGTWKTAASA